VRRWVRESAAWSGPGPGWRRRHPEGSLRRLRRVRAGAAGGPPHLRRAARAAAQGPGIGGYGGERRRHDHRRQGHGPRHQRVRRAQAGAAPGPPGHRPRPVLHHRLEHVGQRAAHLPGHRGRRLRPGAQREPRQHRGAVLEHRRPRRHGHQRQRPGGRAVARRHGVHQRRPQRRARPGTGAGDGAAVPAGRLLPRRHGRLAPGRRPRSQRFPPVVPGPPPDGVGAGLRDAGTRHRGRSLRPRARARRDGRDRRDRHPFAAPFPARPHRPQAVPVRVRLLLTARQPPLRPDGPHRPPTHGRAPRRPGAAPRRHPSPRP
jgi:hypothetical protein